MKIKRYKLFLKPPALSESKHNEESISLQIVPKQHKDGGWVRYFDLKQDIRNLIMESGGVHINEDPEEEKPYVYWEKIKKYFGL